MCHGYKITKLEVENKAAYFIVKNIKGIGMCNIYHILLMEQMTIKRLDYNVLSAMPDT